MVDTSAVDEEEGRGEVTLSVTPVCSVAGLVALLDVLLLPSDVMRLDGMEVMMGSEEGTEVVEGGGLPSVEETAEVGKEEVSMVDTSAVDEEEGRGEVTLSVTPVCSVAGVVALLDVLLLTSDVMRLDGMEVMVGSEEGTEFVEGREVPSVEETADVGNEEASIVDTSAVDEEEGRGEVTLSVTPVCSVAGVVALDDVLLLTSDVMRLDGMEVMVGSEEGTEVVEGRGVPSVEETADVRNEEVSKVDTSAVDEEEGRGEVTLSVTLVCSVVGVVALMDVLLLASDVMRLDGMEVMVGFEEGTEVVESGGLPSVEETADVEKEAVSMVDTSTVDEEEGRGEVTLSVTPVCSVAGLVELVDAMLLASDVMRLDGIVVVMGSEEGTEVVEGRGVPSVEETADVGNEEVSKVDTSAVDEEEGRGEVTLSVTLVCSVVGVVALVDAMLLASDVMRLDGIVVLMGSEEGTEVVEGGGLPSVEETAEVVKEAVSIVDTSAVDEEEGRGEVTLSVTPVCSVAGVVALEDVLLLTSDVMRLDGMEVMVRSEEGTEVVESGGLPSVEETADIGKEAVSMVDTSTVDEEEGRGEVTLSVTPVCSVEGVVALLDVLLLTSDVMGLDGMEVMVRSKEGTEVVEGRGVPSVDVGKEAVSMVDTSAIDEKEDRGEVTLSVTPVCSVAGVVELLDVLLLTSDVMRLDGMEVMVGSEEGTEVVEGRGLPSVEETADVGKEEVSMVDISTVNEEEGRGEVTLSVTLVCSVAGVVALVDAMLLASDVMRLDGMEVMMGSEEGTEVVEGGELPSVEETADVRNEEVSMVDTSAVDEEEGRGEVTLSVTPVCSVAGLVALLDVLLLPSDVMRLDGMEVMMGSEEGTEVVEGGGLPSVEETAEVGKEEVSMVDTSAVDEEEGRGEVTLSVTPVCSVAGVVALLDVLLLTSDVMRLDGMEVMVGSEEGTEFVEGREVPSVEETADVGNEEASIVDTSAVDEEEGRGEVTLSVTPVCSVAGVVALEDVLLLTSDVMRLDGMEVMVGSEEGTEVVEGRGVPSVEETADVRNEEVSKVDTSAVDEEEGRGEVTLSVTLVCSVVGVVALMDVLLLASDVMRLDGMEVMVGSEEGTEVVESGGLPSVEETADVEKESVSMVDTSAVDEEEGRGEVTLSVTPVCSVAGVVALEDVLLLTSDVMRLDGMEVMVGSEEGTEFVEGRGVPSVEEKADVGKEEVSMVDTSTVDEEEGRGEVTLSVTLVCSVAGVVALLDVLVLTSGVVRLDGMEVMMGSEEGTEVVEGRGLPSVEETADAGKEEVSMVDISTVNEEEGRGEVTLSVTLVCSVAGVVALVDAMLLASDVMRLDGMEVMMGSEEGTEVVEVAGVVELLDVLLLTSDVMRLDGMEVMVGSEEGTEVVEGRGLPSVEETADVGKEEVSMVDISTVNEEEGRGEVTLSVTLVCSVAGVVALVDAMLLASDVMRLDGMEVMMGSEEGTEVVEG
ncbi:UNVERIFIED_CONTAM: hypothetical protein K2H54_040451 [Gekko kuhli]